MPPFTVASLATITHSTLRDGGGVRLCEVGVGSGWGYVRSGWGYNILLNVLYSEWKIRM